MKTEWDYTELADAYLKRPDYSPQALEDIFRIAGLKQGDLVCDIGAGVAHLTIPLAKAGFKVDAVEPNDAMRANGKKRTEGLVNVSWSEGTGEHTGRPSGAYDFVSFGSSFNVCDRQKALEETARLLKPGKYFVCLWNHRDLNDSIQKDIEEVIRKHIPDYGYGTRREDQTEIIKKSGLFDDVRAIEGKIVWQQDVKDTIRAWQSHSTLHRQAEDKFQAIIEEIAAFLNSLHVLAIQIPYTTHAWLGRKKA